MACGNRYPRLCSVRKWHEKTKGHISDKKKNKKQTKKQGEQQFTRIYSLFVERVRETTPESSRKRGPFVVGILALNVMRLPLLIFANYISPF